jgi:hypothetical protein
MMQGILTTRRRRAVGIEPPRQRYINLKMEEDTEGCPEGHELLTISIRGVRFSQLFHIWKSRESPEKRLTAVRKI